jgi:hypothetical protein
VEAAINAHIAAQAALIAFLDAADGDPDLDNNLADALDDREGGDIQDERHDAEGPDAAWPENHGRGAIAVRDTMHDDDEPSLAHTLDIDQSRAARRLGPVYLSAEGWITGGLDLEAEHDGREPGE